MFQVKRVYENPGADDGVRFLVERLWPRGLRKADIHMDDWRKDAGPSDLLRKWFSHDPKKWIEFQHRYIAELEERPLAWRPILAAGERGTATLLYSSRDTEHNNAVALKGFLESKARR